MDAGDVAHVVVVGVLLGGDASKPRRPRPIRNGTTRSTTTTTPTTNAAIVRYA
jgi:hypothetical protein